MSLSGTKQSDDGTNRDACNRSNGDAERGPNEPAADSPLHTSGRALLCSSYSEEPCDGTTHASGQGTHGPVAEAAKGCTEEGCYDGRNDGPVWPNHCTPGKHPQNNDRRQPSDCCDHGANRAAGDAPEHGCLPCWWRCLGLRRKHVALQVTKVG